MNQGKLEVVKHEMDRLNINIPGKSELKWTEIEHFKSVIYRVFYPRNGSLRRNGVAIILEAVKEKTVLGCNVKIDRIMSIRLKRNPVNITIIQVYAPTANAEDDKLDSFYNDV